MAPRTLPGLGLKAFDPKGSDNWHTWTDRNWRVVSALTQPRVLSILSELPINPENGDIHILLGGDNANAVVLYDAGEWFYLQAEQGYTAYVLEAGVRYNFNGTSWVPELSNFSASIAPAELMLRKRGSVLGANEPIAVNAPIAHIGAEGWTGSVFRLGAAMVVSATEVWSNVANGTQLVWAVVANGTTELVNRLSLSATALYPGDTNGEVELGSTTNRWSKLWVNKLSLNPSFDDMPIERGEITITSNSDSKITLKKKGSDDVIRSITFTLTEE